MPTNGFSIKPLKVKLVAGEQISPPSVLVRPLEPAFERTRRFRFCTPAVALRRPGGKKDSKAAVKEGLKVVQMNVSF